MFTSIKKRIYGNIKRKTNWKKGSAELISFALTLPCICLILYIIISVIQTGMVKQAIEYAAYTAGRAAVTCESYQEACIECESTAKAALKKSTFGVDSVSTSVNLVGGTSSNGGGLLTWEKGALAEITIKTKITPVISSGEQEMSAVIYMMVEQPAKTY